MRRQRAHDDCRRDRKGENMSEQFVLRVVLTTHEGKHFESVCNVQNLVADRLKDIFAVDSTEIKQVLSV
jgi:hypothetical protein